MKLQSESRVGILGDNLEIRCSHLHPSNWLVVRGASIRAQNSRAEVFGQVLRRLSRRLCHVCVGGDGVGGRAGPSQFFPKSRYFLSASASRSSKRSPMGGRSVEPRCRPAPAFCRMEGPLCGQEPPPKQIRSECRVQTSWRRPISARQLRCGRDLRPSARPAGLPKGEDPGKGFRSAPRDCVV